MKPLISITCASTAIVFVLFSCSPVLYSNVGQNVPLFHGKGEVAASLNLAYASESGIWEDESSGVSAQLATAIGSHTAISTSFYSLSGSSQWNGKGRYFELGIGRFSTNEKTKLIGEIFLGSGFGSLKNTYNNQFVNVNYFKPFIQPSGGFSSTYFDFAFTPRIAFVKYTSQSSNFFDIGDQIAFDEFYSSKKSTLVFEPGFTFRGGFKNVKLNVHYCHSTFRYDKNDYDPVFRNYFSIGIFALFSAAARN